MTAARRAWPLLALLLVPAVAWSAKRSKPGKSSAKLPDFPKEPPDQAAARLWQAGELAASRGDYAWALKQFEDCLKAEPKNEGCKSGLAEAKRRVGWNPKPKKKRKKPAPKAAEEGEGESESSAAVSEEAKREAVKHWNAGIIVYQKGDYSQAREEWEKCVQLDPSNAECTTGLKRAGMPGAEGAKAPEAAK